MTLGPGLRKLALTAHLTVSIGWIGAVIAFLALIVSAMRSESEQTLRTAWLAMDVVGRFAIVPLALVSLASGLVMALGTKWGLFRHYWVLISFVLTVVATVVLLSNMQAVAHFADMAAAGNGRDNVALRGELPHELAHAGIGLLLLLGIQALNMFKPRGMTRYGRRRTDRRAT